MRILNSIGEFLKEKPQSPIPTRVVELSGKQDTVGICFSGGGVRSACYNLGALQALQERGILSNADYLAAVSGGAYIASAHAVLRRGFEKSADASEDADTSRWPAFSRGSPEEKFFRNNSSYIAPGPLDKIRVISVWFRGFLLNTLILGFLLWALGTALGYFLEWAHPGLNAQNEPFPVDWCIGSACLDIGPRGLNPWWIVLFGGVPLVTGFFIYALDCLLDLPKSLRGFTRRGMANLLTFGAVASLLLALPYAIDAASALYEDFDGFTATIRQLSGAKDVDSDAPERWVWLVQGFAALNVVLAGLRLITAKGRSRYAVIVAAFAGPVLVFVPFLSIVRAAATRGGSLEIPRLDFHHTTETVLLVLIFGLVLFLLDTRFNCNKTSLHFFYSRRLAFGFGLKRLPNQVIRPLDIEEMPLKDFQPDHGKGVGPVYIYCAAANTLADRSAPPGRNAVPFNFTASFCGADIVCRLPTSHLEACMGELPVSGAVAISGAAFSPTMGKHTNRLLTFLMTVLNARLGMWVPNPRFHQVSHAETTDCGKLRTLRARWTAISIKAPWPWTPRSGLRYLVYEFLGWHRLDRRYLYVTDGGHYDNLGLLELLRRQCTTILCFDASRDKADTLDTLGEAVGMARADLLTEIDIDPSGMLPGSSGHEGRESVERGDKKRRGNGKKLREEDLPQFAHTIGTFRYPADHGAPQLDGHLIFVKAAVTEKVPWDIRAFHRKDSHFPNHSTFDQLFTDQKFESYRELGYSSTCEALAGYADWRDKRVASGVGTARQAFPKLQSVPSDESYARKRPWRVVVLEMVYRRGRR